MSDVRTVTVRLPEPLHRAVKVRCAERGDSLEGVARAAFVAYLERGDDEQGPVLERAGVRPTRLDAVSPDSTDGARVGKHSFRPDPKGGSK